MRNSSPGNPRGKPTTRAARRKTTKRKAKRKTTKRKTTKRKTTKRKTAKRKTTKRKTTKRKTTKRKTTKRKTALPLGVDSRPPGVTLDSGESSSSKDSDINVLARRFLRSN